MQDAPLVLADLSSFIGSVFFGLLLGCIGVGVGWWLRGKQRGG